MKSKCNCNGHCQCKVKRKVKASKALVLSQLIGITGRKDQLSGVAPAELKDGVIQKLLKLSLLKLAGWHAIWTTHQERNCLGKAFMRIQVPVVRGHVCELSR